MKNHLSMESNLLNQFNIRASREQELSLMGKMKERDLPQDYMKKTIYPAS